MTEYSTTHKEKVKILDNKTIKEWRSYCANAIRKRAVDAADNRTDLDIAFDAYDYAVKQYYVMAQARGLDDPYDDIQMDMIMWHFEDGGTFDDFDDEFAQHVDAVARSVGQPINDPNFTGKQLI